MTSSEITFLLFRQQYVTFTITLPIHFNPVPGKMLGEPIPQKWLSEWEQLLTKQFDGFNSTDGFGGSAYDDPKGEDGRVIYQEPERRYVVDLPIEQLAEAVGWFSDHCPRWASRFQQRELYVKLTMSDGMYIMRFPSSGSSNDSGIDALLRQLPRDTRYGGASL